MPNDRLTKQIFIMDYNRCSNNWSYDIKTIFEELDMLPLYENKEPCDLDTSKNQFVKDFEKECVTEINNKPKLRTFKLFKDNCNPSTYLTSCMNRYERSLLAKFRSGILQLKIETGRFNQTKLEERVCECCNVGQIEDELHFLIKCNLYTELRNRLFVKISRTKPEFLNMNDKDKFIYLMKNVTYAVASFIKNAWELRKSKLYK